MRYASSKKLIFSLISLASDSFASSSHNHSQNFDHAREVYDQHKLKDIITVFCNYQVSDGETCLLDLIDDINQETKSSRVAACVFESESLDRELDFNLDDCLADVLDQIELDKDKQSQNYADGDFAVNDFFEQFEQDFMLQQILGDIHVLEQKLAAEQELAGLENSLSARNKQDQVVSGWSKDDSVSIEEHLRSLKRFVELKQLIAWLQPVDKRISRFCFYGCWCLPEGAHSFVAGEGRPVDLVDKACQYLWFCYTCAEQEFAVKLKHEFQTCKPDMVKYAFKFKYNKKDPYDYDQRDITCRDKFYHPMDTILKFKSNCAKAICECDRGLAKRLYHSFRHWDKSRHRIWSQKAVHCKQMQDCHDMPQVTEQERLKKANCLKQGCLFIPEHRCVENGLETEHSHHQKEVCCGIYEDMGGRMEMRDHGGLHACCNQNAGSGYKQKLPWNGNWYSTVTHCCPNGQILAKSSSGCG